MNVALYGPSPREIKKRKEREEYDRKRGSIFAKPKEKPWGRLFSDRRWGHL